VPLKTCRCKRVAHKKYRVYHSHTHLYVDFSWDSVARKNSFAFGVNAPLGVSLTVSRSLYTFKFKTPLHGGVKCSVFFKLPTFSAQILPFSFRLFFFTHCESALHSDRWLKEEKKDVTLTPGPLSGAVLSILILMLPSASRSLKTLFSLSLPPEMFKEISNLKVNQPPAGFDSITTGVWTQGGGELSSPYRFVTRMKKLHTPKSSSSLKCKLMQRPKIYVCMRTHTHYFFNCILIVMVRYVTTNAWSKKESTLSLAARTFQTNSFWMWKKKWNKGPCHKGVRPFTLHYMSFSRRFYPKRLTMSAFQPRVQTKNNKNTGSNISST